MREAWDRAANRRHDPSAQALRPIVSRGMPNRSDARRPTDRTDDALRVSVRVRQDHNLAFLKVEEPGADLREVVRLGLRELCLHRVGAAYADLPLSHRATAQAGAVLAVLRDLGFFRRDRSEAS
jgi:hypothetical protein